MEESFSAQGFHVLGFYSDDFQQAGDPGDIEGCTSDYGVTYDQFLVGEVTQPSPQPVFEWLLSQPNPGPASGSAPTWNFHKYLVSRDGELVAHWPTSTYPGDDPNDPNDSFATSEIVLAIEAELAR